MRRRAARPRRSRSPIRYARRHRFAYDHGEWLAVLAGASRYRGRAACSASRSPCCCRSDRLQIDRCACAGVTATDLVLTVTQLLRQKGCRQIRRILRAGLDHLSLADRATIANMARNMARLRFLPHRFGDAFLSRDVGANTGPCRSRRSYAKHKGCIAPRRRQIRLHRYAIA